MEFPISASCQCGQVEYQLHEAPFKVLACHCTECQKLATSPFSVTALVYVQDIEFKGEMHEWQRSSESGNINAAKFCPGCGNRIYHFNPAAPEVIKLKLKPVAPDVQSLFQPTTHVWVKEKQSWYEIPQGVEVFEKQS